MNELKAKIDTLEALTADLDRFDKEPVERFAPVNGDIEKSKFLAGEIDRPNHNYEKLAEVDFNRVIPEIKDIRNKLGYVDTKSGSKDSYQDFANQFLLIAKLEKAAFDFKTAASEEAGEMAANDFMKSNIELYGEPDEETYRELLAGELKAIAGKDLSGDAAQMRDDLFGSVDQQDILEGSVEKYSPKPETMARVKNFAEVVYGPLLDHVPDEPSDGQKYNAGEIRNIFAEIIDEEFADQAEGWIVEISDTKKSIDVSPRERKISIPVARQVEKTTLEGLICHELGVHMMRSLMGEQTDFAALRTGLANYYPSEEGLGVVVEQALKGKYAEAGVQYYLIAGAAYFDQKSWRQCFDMMRQIKILGSLPEGSSEITESTNDSKSSLAYNAVQRVFRGTDALPLFKDLAYYNGSANIWKYLDSHLTGNEQIDAEIFARIFSGKQDITNSAHAKVMQSVSPSDNYH